MPLRPLSHTVGFDDAPFAPEHRGDVDVVGMVYTGTRLDGVVRGRVRRDGANSTEVLARLVAGSRFAEHLHAVLLQGIAVGGFNVVDIHRLHERLGLPVLVVARKAPDLAAIRRALLERVPGGARKGARGRRAGLMEPAGDVWVQRAGLTPDEAEAVVDRLAIHGHLPEPLRVAHLVAGGLATRCSRGRA